MTTFVDINGGANKGSNDEKLPEFIIRRWLLWYMLFAGVLTLSQTSPGFYVSALLV